MTTAKMSELIAMVDDELEARLGEASQELFNLRFQVVTGQLDNTARITHVRRDIARLKTLLRARAIEGDASSDAEYQPSDSAPDDQEER